MSATHRKCDEWPANRSEGASPALGWSPLAKPRPATPFVDAEASRAEHRADLLAGSFPRLEIGVYCAGSRGDHKCRWRH
jgi:hypothetical protein